MPYNPGIEYRGDRYLFAGLAGLGQSIGDALRTRDQRSYQAGLERDRRKQEEVDLAAEDAKKAKATRTFLSTWMPDQKDKFDTMGLEELVGTSKALAQKQIDKDQSLREEAQRLNIAAVRDAAQKRVREANATHGFLSDLESFDSLATAANGEPSMALSPELRTQLTRPGGVGLAALARNPDVPEDLRDRALSGTLRPSAVKSQWNLQPGQVIDYGEGSFGLAATPNSVVVRMPPKPSKADKPKPLSAANQRRLDELVTRRSAVTTQIEDLGKEIGSGNERPGPDWLPFTTKYSDRRKALEDQAAELDQRISELKGQPQTPTPPATKPGASPAEPAMDIDREAEDARRAIQQGAPAAAVAERYRQRTGKILF